MTDQDPVFDIWHVAIPVSDLERSEAFYCDGLGFLRIGRDEYPSKKQSFVAVREGGFTIELFEPLGPAVGSPKRPDHLAFECPDLAAFRAALVKRRVADVPPVDELDDGVRMLELSDPDGISLQFFQGRVIYEAALREEEEVGRKGARGKAAGGPAPAGVGSAQAPLVEYALGFPGAHEDHPWGETVTKVRKKVFAFFGVPDPHGSWGLHVKLPLSGRAALELSFTKPTGYGLGKSGWVSARFEAGEEAPLDLLRSWIDESYRAVAPKKLVAKLDRGSRASKPAATRSGTAPRARPRRR